MNVKIYDILAAAQEGTVIYPPNMPTVDVLANRRVFLEEASKIEEFFIAVSKDLDMNLVVVGGGHGCTKITITTKADSKEETKRILEELFSSDVFAKKAVKVGFDTLLRDEPYAHKTLSSGRILGKIVGEGLPVFLSYSSEDEEYRDELEKHLSALVRQKIISAWHDRKLFGGESWDKRIKEELKTTRLFIFLVSADFLASDYCMNIELPYAVTRHSQVQSDVVPIITRPSDWEETSLGQFQALPDRAKPVTVWSNRGEAWTAAAKGIRRLVRELRQA